MQIVHVLKLSHWDQDKHYTGASLGILFNGFVSFESGLFWYSVTLVKLLVHPFIYLVGCVCSYVDCALLAMSSGVVLCYMVHNICEDSRGSSSTA